jgi:hypothetical protein
MFLWVVGGLASPLPISAVRVVLIVAVIALILRDLGVVRFRLPQNHWQVPQSVLSKPGLQPALRFGAELGAGFRTYIPTASPYMLALALVLLPVPWGAAAGAASGFALGRAATPTVRLFSGDVSAWDKALEWRLPVLTGTAGVMSASLVGVLVLYP